MAILPIVTYNDPVLRKEAKEVEENTEELQTLIDDMFETMYNSDGVGLAAPQIGKPLKFFVMDSDPMTKDEELNYGPMVLINPIILEKKGNKIPMEEGCLSIPGLNDKVFRHETVVVEYSDRDFNKHRLEANGWTARVILHEYDHLDGVLFIDHLSSFKKRMHKSELEKIDKGEAEVDYPVAPREVAG